MKELIEFFDKEIREEDFRLATDWGRTYERMNWLKELKQRAADSITQGRD
jgi:hypothetical protein